MELVLNLVWAMLAAGAWICFLRSAPHSQISQRTRIAALIMLVVILFPAISLSDDLWAAQNPQETDTFVRRHDHATPDLHPVHPSALALPCEPAFMNELLRVGRLEGNPRGSSSLAAAVPPALQNRPPPRSAV